MNNTLKYTIKVKCVDGSLKDEKTCKEESMICDKVGTFSIGRGTFPNLLEKKCSRKQISIIINDDNTYYISSNGVNPSYYKKYDEEYFVQMNKDQNYQLHNKDCFSLLYEMYTFMVIFESTNINENNDNDIASSSNISNSSSNSSNTGNKRKLEQEQADDTKPKKMCPYGSDCFRKNPTHFEEFDHIDNKKKQQQKQHKDNDDNNNNNNNIKNQQIVNKSENDEENKIRILQDQKQQSSPQIMASTSKNNTCVPINSIQQQQQQQKQEEQDNSNIGKIIGPKYKKKKLTDSHKERSLAFPFISTTVFEFDINKATEIAAKAISEYLSFHEQEGDDIKLKMFVEKSIYSDQLIENFKKQFNNKWDKRFEISKIDNSNSIEQFNSSCKFFATETNWRLKKTPQNKVLYDEMLDNQFEKETKNRFQTGKIGKVYPIPLSYPNSSKSTLKNEYGVECVVLVLGPNMNEKKPDQFKDYNISSPLLLETYHSLFSLLDNF